MMVRNNPTPKTASWVRYAIIFTSMLFVGLVLKKFVSHDNNREESYSYLRENKHVTLKRNPNQIRAATWNIAGSYF